MGIISARLVGTPCFDNTNLEDEIGLINDPGKYFQQQKFISAIRQPN